VVEVLPPPACVNSMLREVLVVVNGEITKREIRALECLEKGIKEFSQEEISERVSSIFKT